MEQIFVTPPDHVKFMAKKLCNDVGTVADASVAYIEPDGGGPREPHVHKHDHFFIVVHGEAKILLDGRKVILKENESFLVKGEKPHSVWNNANCQTVMIGLTVLND